MTSAAPTSPVARAAALLLALGSWGCTNPCEKLCDSYFQMQLRCDLLACDACVTQDVCTGDEGTPADPNVQLQETEYTIQQCQADYRRLRDGDGDTSEAEACSAYLPTVDRLLSAYDDETSDCNRRALCDEFAALQAEMGLLDAVERGASSPAP